ncbi:hypothetical protein LTR95_010510 [Oleoguttula sp. CCFEE 5521]
MPIKQDDKSPSLLEGAVGANSKDFTSPSASSRRCRLTPSRIFRYQAHSRSKPDHKVMPTIADHGALSRLEAYRASYIALTGEGNFDTNLYQSVRIISCSHHPATKSGTASYALTFPAHYCNYSGTVHGGAIATLLDGLTNCSIAVVAKDGFWDKGGVTRSLGVRYIKPIKVGEAVTVDVDVLSASKTSAVIRGVVRREEDGEVLATCEMEKFDPLWARL